MNIYALLCLLMYVYFTFCFQKNSGHLYKNNLHLRFNKSIKILFRLNGSRKFKNNIIWMTWKWCVLNFTWNIAILSYKIFHSRLQQCSGTWHIALSNDSTNCITLKEVFKFLFQMLSFLARFPFRKFVNSEYKWAWFSNKGCTTLETMVCMITDCYNECNVCKKSK